MSTDRLKEIRKRHANPGSYPPLDLLVAKGDIFFLLAEIDRLKSLPDDLSSSPWSADVWTMTKEKYCKVLPDLMTRTAVSGYLMRRGWELAVEKMKELAQEVPDE